MPQRWRACDPVSQPSDLSPTVYRRCHLRTWEYEARVPALTECSKELSGADEYPTPVPLPSSFSTVRVAGYFHEHFPFSGKFLGLGPSNLSDPHFLFFKSLNILGYFLTDLSSLLFCLVPLDKMPTTGRDLRLVTPGTQWKPFRPHQEA